MSGEEATPWNGTPALGRGRQATFEGSEKSPHVLVGWRSSVRGQLGLRERGR
jgi:hypothetical protein